MTVARSNNRWTFPGGTSAVSFAITEVVYDAAHLVVGIVNDTTRVYTALTLGAGFSVTGIGNATGCTVTLTATVASGSTLYIDIRPPSTQTLELSNVGAFNPRDIEQRFDEIAYRLHTLEEVQSRCVKFAEGENAPAQLAGITTRGGKFVAFTAGGAFDYLPGTSAGAGDFLNLPVADTFVPGGVLLWQSPSGAGGGTVLYSPVDEIRNSPLESIVYSTSTTLSTGDSGKVIKSTGQTTNIVYTLPAGAADLFYVIHADSDTFTIYIDPNGSERIGFGAAGEDREILVRGWMVIQWDGGRWEVTESTALDSVLLAKLAELLAPRMTSLLESFNIYTVLKEGAVVTNQVADEAVNLAAFQATAAKVTSRSGTVLIPTPAGLSAASSEPLRLYRLPNGRWLEDFLGTAADEIPGGTTDLRFRLGLTQGPLLVPHGHRIVGQGGYPRDTTSPVGSEIWALAGMTRRLEVTSMTRSGTTVTVEAKNHGLTPGANLKVEGASVAAYNVNPGTVATVTDWDTFTYTVGSSGTDSATGYTVTTTLNPRVVQLGPSSNTAGLDSSRAEKLTINGRNVAGAIGVWTDCAQENSGVYDSAIIGCFHGVVAQASGSIVPANFYIERTHIVLSSTAGNQGDGVQIFGGKMSLNKVSTICRSVPGTGDSGYVLRGADHIGNNLHFENFDYGLTIGGPDTGTPNDTGVWDYNITVDNLHGVNLNTNWGLIAAARIRNDSTSVFNIALTDISINVHNKGPAWVNNTVYTAGQRVSISSSNEVQLECVTGGTSAALIGDMPTARPVGAANITDNGVTWKVVHLCALVLDEVNAINIPSKSSTNSRHLAYYRCGGTMGVDAATAVVTRPVFTSYYDGLCPDGAVKAQTAQTTLDRTFTGGGRADILQINYTGTSAITIDMLNAPAPGDVVYLDCQTIGYSTGSVTIRHDTGATATQRILCPSATNVTVTAGARYRLTYGGDSGSPTKWNLEVV